MLRGIQSITAIIVACAIAGCSSSQGEQSASESQAATAACRHGVGGTRTVSLLCFDATSLELSGVASDGSYVDVRLTTSTLPVAANVRLFPPDPIFPQCRNDAVAWNGLVGDGLTAGVRSELSQLANDGCDLSITQAADGSVVSVQPVP